MKRSFKCVLALGALGFVGASTYDFVTDKLPANGAGIGRAMVIGAADEAGTTYRMIIEAAKGAYHGAKDGAQTTNAYMEKKLGPPPQRIAAAAPPAKVQPSVHKK